MKGLWKKITSVMLTAAVVCSMSLSAGAISFTVPTSPISTDDGVIKTTAARAGQVAPLILGCDLVGSSNLGASSGDYNKVNSILGVFGSDINETPDPYLYNYNYNLYAAENGKETVKNATISEEQSEGTAATSEAILNILEHRPDLILNQGAGTGTADQNENYSSVIATLTENTDADTSNDYTPSYFTCSISSLVYQCENLINLSKAVKTVCSEKNLTTRYGDPYTIATDYDKFVWGYYFYIQSELSAKNIEKKNVAVVSKTEDEGATWTLPAQATKVSQNKPNRLVEYTRDNTSLLNTTEETTASLKDVLSCDVVIANGSAGTTLKAAASVAGYAEDSLPLIIDTLPTCLYGMIMQTHENALGIPYIQSIIYNEELGLNPVYAAAYYYEKFFHITDQEALQETVNTLLGKATLPEGVTTSLSGYDPQKVEEEIIQGINYAADTKGKRQDDTEVWNPDLSVGIGSGVPFTDLTSDWYQNAVKYVYHNKLMNGVSDTEFAPETTMTRAMAVTTLYRLNGSPEVSGESTFSDLNADWYKAAVSWAQSSKITTGTSETTFAPDQSITRQEFVTLFARYLASFEGVDTAEGKASISTYPDASSVADYAVSSVEWAVGNGVISGVASGDSSVLLDPSGVTTRAQVAQILTNYLN